MKRFLFLILILLVQCSKNSEQKEKPVHSAKKVSIKVSEKQSENFDHWLNFYKTENPNFSLENFKETGKRKIIFSKGTVLGNFDKDFNIIYEPFLVYSPDKTKYVDFDSYNWGIAEDGNASFEADQSINLVDLKEKSVKQIAFFGPSSWIEDAFWKDNSTIILLGNSYEKVPFYLEFDFKNNTETTFQTSDTLKFETPYSKIRLQRKGVLVE